MQALLRSVPGTAKQARLALQRAFTSLPVIDVSALLEPDQVRGVFFAPGMSRVFIQQQLSLDSAYLRMGHFLDDVFQCRHPAPGQPWRSSCTGRAWRRASFMCKTTVRLMQRLQSPCSKNTSKAFESSLVPTAGIAASDCTDVLEKARQWFSLPVRPLSAPVSLTKVSWRLIRMLIDCLGEL